MTPPTPRVSPDVERLVGKLLAWDAALAHSKKYPTRENLEQNPTEGEWDALMDELRAAIAAHGTPDTTKENAK